MLPDNKEYREKMGRFRLFVPFILPFILSWLPFMVLSLEQGPGEKLRVEEEQRRWEEAALRRVETFRSMNGFGPRIETMGRDLEKRLRACLKKRNPNTVSLDGPLLRRTFEEVFPISHRPPGTLLYGCSLNATGKAVGFSGRGFAPEKGRIIGDLLASFLHGRPSHAEHQMLDRKCAGLFAGTYGPLYRFDILADSRRGRLTPIIWSGKRAFLLWKPIVFGTRTLGAFLTIFPDEAPGKTKPLMDALNHIARSSSLGMVPMLLPFPRPGSPHRIVTAPGHPAPKAVRPFVSAFFRSGGQRSGFDAGKLHSEEHIWLLREFLSLDIPYELWIVSKPPRATSTLLPLPFFCGLLLSASWGLLFARILILGTAPILSLRVWFLGFFLLVGALPLSIFTVNGSMHIENFVARQRHEVIRAARARLEKIDAESDSCFSRYATLCRAHMENRNWRRPFLHGTPETCRAAVEEAITDFHAAGLPLDGVFSFPRSGDSFAWPPGIPEGRGDENMSAMRFLQPMLDGAYQILEGTPREKTGEKSGKTGPIAREIYDLFAGAEAGRDFLAVRGYGDIIKTGRILTYQFHDVLAVKGKLETYMVFRTNIAAAFQTYLTNAIRGLNFPKHSNARYAVGREVPGGLEPVFPSLTEGNLWESTNGILLRKTMDLAARTHSYQSLVREGVAIMAYPCQKTEGFGLGAILPLSPIEEARTPRYLELALFTGILGFPILLLGVFTVQGLLNPLRRMEQGLIRAADGDLSVRLRLERDDELGDLTNAFDHMITGLSERKKLGRFVSGTLDAAVSERLGSENAAPREISGVVLVSDLRSFTSISESYPVREVTAMLNRHLEAMSACIQLHGGLIDKFIGDAVVAVFTSAPPRVLAQRATRAALAMVEACKRLNDTRRVAGLFPYRMGIGIDSGPLVMGTLASSGRLEHVILGEPRNNAERLESSSRNGKHTCIVVSPDIVRNLQNAVFLPLNDSPDSFELVSLPEPLIPNGGIGHE